MKQYNLIYPILSDTLVIYNGDNPKEIAIKIFKKLVYKYKDIRICLQDNETKQFIYYVGTTRDKLDIYENLFNDVYPNQIGGSMSYPQDLPKQINSLKQDNLTAKINSSSIMPQNKSQIINQDRYPKQFKDNNQYSSIYDSKNTDPSFKDKNFVKNINSVADNLAFSAQEIGKLISEKYSPKEEEPSQKLLYLVETGLTKLDTINSNLNNISKDVSNLSNKISDFNNNNVSDVIPEENITSNNNTPNKNCIIM
tara:strand:- start:2466 stop:3224 length:759 start_codon:yes stop_codon:yes gene_type:complete